MKLVQAIIEPSRLDAVTEALATAEIFRLTVIEVEGAGHEEQRAEVAGGEVTLDFAPMLRLEIAVNDEFVEPTVEAIRQGMGGDNPGIGKIFILPLDDVVRIRTGERGSEAI